MITRSQATDKGLEFYTSGKPCKRGQTAPRRTSNGQCTCDPCLQYRSAKNSATASDRYNTDPEYRARRKWANKQARAVNKERNKEWAKQYRLEHTTQTNARARKWYNTMPETERKLYAKQKYYTNVVSQLLSNAKGRALRNGITFDLTRDDVVVPDVCPVFGEPFVWGVGEGRNDFSPSLDRIIPDRGYVRGNVQVISWLANRLKSNATLMQLQQVCAYVAASVADQNTLP